MSVFVVVGATGGIGSAVARRLRARGFSVRLIGRDEQRLAALAAETGGGYAVADATQVTELEAAIGDGVQGIVNCVGSLLLKPCHLTSEAEWEQVIRTNLTSAYATVRAGAKAMMSTGGSIVLCSTAAARMGMANHEAIAAAKGGVMGLALSAAATYAPRRIRVNCVAPGLVDTPLAARITGNAAALQASTAMHPLGRIGTADDVASGIVWLLDPENSWVTGQVLGIDGGLGTLRSRQPPMGWKWRRAALVLGTPRAARIIGNVAALESVPGWSLRSRKPPAKWKWRWAALALRTALAACVTGRVMGIDGGLGMLPSR